jgi:hypothetical protein
MHNLPADDLIKRPLVILKKKKRSAGVKNLPIINKNYKQAHILIGTIGSEVKPMQHF